MWPFHSKLFSLILLAAIGWLSLSLFSVRSQKQQIGKEVTYARTKISALERENAALKEFLAFAEHPSFLERELRLRLNYKAPDEQVAFVYPDDEKPASPSFEGTGKPSVFSRLADWLFGILDREVK